MKQIKTFGLDSKVPHGLVRGTLKVQCNNDGYVGGDLDKCDNGASPPKRALRSCSWGDKYTALLDEDDNLEKGQDE